MPTPDPTGRMIRTAPPSRDTFGDLPASAKLVFTVLDWEGSLTRQAIERETRLASRTVHDALVRLDDHGIVDTRPNFEHAQQPYYDLATARRPRDSPRETR